MEKEKNPILETASFAAGCFWGVEEIFRTTRGVMKTAAGYMGGWLKNPAYLVVCTGASGHAEAVQVKFDPKKVSFEKLLEIFWGNHNPTTLNRQGPDIGSQYRSAIFYHSAEQKTAAEKSLKELQGLGRFKNKIVTQIVPAGEFFPAEEYHQKYLYKKRQKNCHV